MAKGHHRSGRRTSPSDADAAVARIREAGGAVMMEPMTVMDVGRMAVVADPTGAVFGLWQAGEHKGAEIANEPGAVTWNECLTRDFPTAKAFYTRAFGYGTQDLSAEGFAYTAIEVDGQTVGGLGDMGGMWPAEVPPHWLTYFAVADTDTAAARATELGGTVQRPGRDGGFGRIAVLQGPNGETFAGIGPNTETADATRTLRRGRHPPDGRVTHAGSGPPPMPTCPFGAEGYRPRA